ncbi:MAG: type II toxin-antitoxin system PemK/MazF family toxin [Candidatus Krumholzibacteria bacterium]|nr:type II toxin-antitoxin system PemK/MazF family toxin [Candidatus Krumholzibacteria bacterium]
MKRGEIRWYRFPQPDKKRPVLILTRDSIISHLNEVTVAPLTRTIRGIPTEVVLTEADSVPSDCAVNCDHLQTVSKGRLGSVITTLSADKMAEIGPAVRFALGFS